MEYISIKNDNGKEYQIEVRKDGYVNATMMCKHANKIYPSWKRLDFTKKFIQIVMKETNMTENELIQTTYGGNCKSQGTWIHRFLVLNLANWCSMKFGIVMAKWIEEWTKSSMKNNMIYHETIYTLKDDENENDDSKKELYIQTQLHKMYHGEIEKKCECGFIDLINDTVIIEIKTSRLWKHAVGQILMYGLEYPSHKKIIYLFNIEKDNNFNKELVEEKCGIYDIVVKYWNEI